MSFKKKLIPKIWGGKNLEDFFSYENLKKNYGESWEISVIKGFESVVKKGVFKNTRLDRLIEKYPVEILGGKVYDKYGLNFPILIKFIDVNKPLSINPLKSIYLKVLFYLRESFSSIFPVWLLVLFHL